MEEITVCSRLVLLVWWDCSFPLHLTNQSLPRTLSANHVPAVKPTTALLSVAVSCHFRHSSDPPPPHPPPALHLVDARINSPVARSPGSLFLHHLHHHHLHHKCLDSIRGGVSYSKIHHLPKYFFITMETNCTHGNKSSCSLKIITYLLTETVKCVCPFFFILGKFGYNSTISYLFIYILMLLAVFLFRYL